MALHACRLRSTRASAAALTTLALASLAQAQVGIGDTISHNNAIFTLADYVGGATGTGASTIFRVNGAGGANNLGQAWWWGRADVTGGGGDPREQAVSLPTASKTKSAGGDSLSLTYLYTTGSGTSLKNLLQLTVTFQVVGLGVGAGAIGFGQLIQTVTVTNLSSTTFTYNLFNYNNLANFGTPNNKTAQQISPSKVRFIDGLNPLQRADYEVVSGPAGTRIDVSSTAGSPTVRGRLTDNSINNFSGSILNAGPANLEVGSQFVFANLAPNASGSASVILTLPTPGSAALLGLGGLLASRRKRV